MQDKGFQVLDAGQGMYWEQKKSVGRHNVRIARRSCVVDKKCIYSEQQNLLVATMSELRTKLCSASSSGTMPLMSAWHHHTVPVAVVRGGKKKCTGRHNLRIAGQMSGGQRLIADDQR